MRGLVRLGAMRARAEARMTSSALVKRSGGGPPLTDSDGFEVDAWETVYEGPFRLSGSPRGGAGSRTVRVGDVDVELAVRVGNFPAATTGLRDGDLIQITGGENAGGFLRIVEASWQDQATALRVPVVEAQRPGGWS
jgi:hypothetical protein